MPDHVETELVMHQVLRAHGPYLEWHNLYVSRTYVTQPGGTTRTHCMLADTLVNSGGVWHTSETGTVC